MARIARPPRGRIVWLFLGILGGSALAVGAVATTGGGQEAWASETQVAAFAGGDAERCVPAAPGQRLCSWHIPGQLIEGADASKVGDGVNMICRLPVGDRVAAGPCRVHARGVPPTPVVKLPAVSAAPVAEAPEARLPELAEGVKLLAGARTVTELSHLVGALPEACSPAARTDKQSCQWRLDAGTQAQERLSVLSPSGRAVALRCVIAADGSDRGPNSCTLIEPPATAVR